MLANPRADNVIVGERKETRKSCSGPSAWASLGVGEWSGPYHSRAKAKRFQTPPTIAS
jgi:hypothetical protein